MDAALRDVGRKLGEYDFDGAAQILGQALADIPDDDQSERDNTK